MLIARRNTVLMIVCFVLIASTGLFAVDFIPTDDTYIRADENEYENYGAEEEVYVRQISVSSTDLKYNRHGYVKFDVTSFTGEIGSAELQMTVTRATGSTDLGTIPNVNFYLLDDADDGWEELVLTHNSAPASFANPPSNEMFSFEFNIHVSDDPDTTYTFDVTEWVAADANGIISIVMIDMSQASTTLKVHSKENTAGGAPMTLVLTEATAIDSELDETPKVFQLAQNYPNPFNPSTTIDYSLEQTTELSIVVYDVLGNQVKTLVNNTVQAGNHSIVWDGTNMENSAVTTGIYFCQMTGNNMTKTLKMVLSK